ncbi:hypothetical protein MRB53_016677 [Persea americana]|uniref:Uncharacterized protein n=1 Tax=Persea americana TaxID=3435 RepID=A0ACC2M2U8_PERAE|nr:hypothetical protein MRB53_016677 [Persea americana]
MYKYQKDTKEKWKGSFGYAWARDENAKKREKGVPMTLVIAILYTKKYRVVVLDAPRHKDFVPYMISGGATMSGATQANATILFIDASVGAFEMEEIAQSDQPSLHSNPSPLDEYGKALLKVDRMDKSSFLKTLQRGVATATKEEESIVRLSAMKNAWLSTVDGALGIPSAPIHMVTSGVGQLKDQLWHTVHTIVLAIFLVFVIGALIEDMGISKWNCLNEEVLEIGRMSSRTGFLNSSGEEGFATWKTPKWSSAKANAQREHDFPEMFCQPKFMQYEDSQGVVVFELAVSHGVQRPLSILSGNFAGCAIAPPSGILVFFLPSQVDAPIPINHTNDAQV